jgi:hypothetical protein
MLAFVLLAVTFVIAYPWVVLLNGTIVPNLVALLTKSDAPGLVKFILAFVLNAVLALLAPIVVAGSGDLVLNEAVVLTFILSLATSQVLWEGLFKKYTAPAIQDVTGGFGLGPSLPAAKKTPSTSRASSR